jgi:hypothetical protein
MPWKSLGKFSRKLASRPAASRAAAKQANAILRSGAPEGVAIATALKHQNRLARKGMISSRAQSKHADVDATATLH